MKVPRKTFVRQMREMFLRKNIRGAVLVFLVSILLIIYVDVS